MQTSFIPTVGGVERKFSGGIVLDSPCSEIVPKVDPSFASRCQTFLTTGLGVLQVPSVPQLQVGLQALEGEKLDAS